MSPPPPVAAFRRKALFPRLALILDALRSLYFKSFLGDLDGLQGSPLPISLQSSHLRQPLFLGSPRLCCEPLLPRRLLGYFLSLSCYRLGLCFAIGRKKPLCLCRNALPFSLERCPFSLQLLFRKPRLFHQPLLFGLQGCCLQLRLLFFAPNCFLREAPLFGLQFRKQVFVLFFSALGSFLL